MSIIPKLATSQNKRSDVPNQELAKEIAAAGDKKAVKELFENLTNKDKAIQSDCIKVIYETAMIKPKLIAAYSNELIALLTHKNNRMQWGAMIALDLIAAERPAEIFGALPKIIDTADKGSVITNDHCVGILTTLCGTEQYADDAFPLLNERLLKSPTNQLPKYAENALPAVSAKNRDTFLKTLTARLRDMEEGTKRIRLEKVIKKLNK